MVMRRKKKEPEKNAFLEEDVHKYGQLTFDMLTIDNKG